MNFVRQGFRKSQMDRQTDINICRQTYKIDRNILKHGNIQYTLATTIFDSIFRFRFTELGRHLQPSGL